MNIRDIAAADLPGLLALNNEHAREVNALSEAELAGLVRVAAAARIVDGGVGFIIAFDQTTPAQGPNHGWYLANVPAFVYIDRVVVAATARGQGVARRLYGELMTIAGSRPLCCEINIDPPNPASAAFHARLGFTACGEAVDPRNGKRVRYLIRRPPADSQTAP